MGTAPMLAMMPNSHHGVMTYPLSRPQVKAAPPMAGPTARPMAEMETANPLSVPRMRSETAELVSKITEQGNAKITAKHLTTMMPNIMTCCHIAC